MFMFITTTISLDATAKMLLLLHEHVGCGSDIAQTAATSRDYADLGMIVTIIIDSIIVIGMMLATQFFNF